MSVAAFDELWRIAVGQFLVPKHWRPVDHTWRPHRQGFLDLCSGRKGVARELVRRADVWALTFEIEEDRVQQDLGLFVDSLDGWKRAGYHSSQSTTRWGCAKIQNSE